MKSPADTPSEEVFLNTPFPCVACHRLKNIPVSLTQTNRFNGRP